MCEGRRMHRLFSTVLAVVAALVANVAFSASAEVTNARLWNSPDRARLVLDISRDVEHKIMTLSKPDRLVLDISNVKKGTRFDLLDLDGSPVKGIRSAVRNGDDLRVVLDLKAKVNPQSFLLKPNDQYGNRLVVDLYSLDKPSAKPKVTKQLNFSGNKRDIIVMVDPGHGGEDPGALGPGKEREKDVVLAIARDLVASIDARPGYKAYLTRTGDYYISLRKRTQIARQHNADLLVSIHADAFTKAQANGASVFALSDRGATSEMARWLAQKENAADLIGGGGVSIDDKDDMLASVLLDLSSTASIKASLTVGDHVLKSVGSVARLHKHQVQQAGFVVLKSPDIPSILIETGFISNPTESRRLKTRKYQKQIAASISAGIQKHFTQSPPVGSLVAWQQSKVKASYTVRRGDTLSHIASRASVSLKDLREINKLSSDTVYVGQELRLPSS